MHNSRDFKSGYTFIDSFIRRLRDEEVFAIASLYPDTLNNFLDKMIISLSKNDNKIVYLSTDDNTNIIENKNIKYKKDKDIKNINRGSSTRFLSDCDYCLIDNIDRFKLEDNKHISLSDFSGIYRHNNFYSLILTTSYTINNEVYTSPASIVPECIDFNLKDLLDEATYLMIIDDTNINKQYIDVLLVDVKLKVSNKVKVKTSEIFNLKEVRNYRKLLENVKNMGLDKKEIAEFADNWKGEVLC